MIAAGLLISCATPLTSCPMAVSFCLLELLLRVFLIGDIPGEGEDARDLSALAHGRVQQGADALGAVVPPERYLEPLHVARERGREPLPDRRRGGGIEKLEDAAARPLLRGRGHHALRRLIQLHDAAVA